MHTRTRPHTQIHGHVTTRQRNQANNSNKFQSIHFTIQTQFRYARKNVTIRKQFYKRPEKMQIALYTHSTNSTYVQQTKIQHQNYQMVCEFIFTNCNCFENLLFLFLLILILKENEYFSSEHGTKKKHTPAA